MKTNLLAVALMTLGMLAGTAMAAAPQGPKTDAFEALLQKVQANPGATTEREVLDLMRQGPALGRSYAAWLAVKGGYLTHRFELPPEVALMAAETAWRAGDYRAAAARFKAYLKTARPSNETADVAAMLYLTDIDLLGAEDDAYLFMTQDGERLRRSAAARKFDGWYIEQAARRQDFANLARWIYLVLADKLPLEQERLFYWEQLDWLMTQVRTGGTNQFAALPWLRKIVPLVRGDDLRRLRYDLYVANLGFRAGSAGKDAAALARDFQAVQDAARRYIGAAPTAETVRDVVLALAGGGPHFSDGAWRQQQDQKRDLFVWAFEKVPEAARAELLNWAVTRAYSGELASPPQWAALGLKSPDLFRRTEGTRAITFDYATADADRLRAQAAFLQGVPSRAAAVINSLAAGSKDLKRAVDHLVRHESWYLDGPEVYEILSRSLWPAWRKLNTDGDNVPAEQVFHEAVLYFGDTYLARTPLGLFDTEGAKSYINVASSAALEGANPTAVIPRLQALAWVPYAARERNEIFGGPYRTFRLWAENLRKEARKKDSTVKPETLQAIVPLEDAFKTAQTGNGDLSKAPDDLCRTLAQAILADRAKRSDELLKLTGQLYPMVKDYAKRRPVLGAAVFRYLFDSRREAPTYDLQLQALADLLKDFDPAGTNKNIQDLIYLMMNRRNWEFGRMRREQLAEARKLNRVFEQAMLREAERGAVPPQLFEWFRTTRQGFYWHQKDWGEPLYERIIEKRLLANSAWRPPGVQSAAVSYMWLVRNDAPGLARKYPVETSFDDLFVEEAQKTGRLDRRYWDLGRDEKRKVVNAAAKMLASYETLPLGYNGEPVAYDRADFWDWQARALGADPAVRDEMADRIEATYGKTRFDTYAMGRAYFSTGANVQTPAGRQEFFKRLDAYVARQLAAPARVGPPYMGALATIGDPKAMTKAEVDALVRIFPFGAPPTWNQGWHFENLALVLVRALVAQGRAAEVYDLVPMVWRIARDTQNGDFQQELALVARDLVEREQFDLAYVFSDLGLEIAKAGLSGGVRDHLTAVRSKTIRFIGPVVPVKPGDREYPIYMAQVAYLTGRYSQAWDAYLANRTLVLHAFKNLDPNFLLWLIDKHTELREFDRAEELAREMIQWFDSVPEGFGAEARGRLLLSYARISLARKEFPKARAQFDRIVQDPEFEGTQAKREAQIGVAEVHRLTSRYDEAILLLEQLARRKDPYLQTEAYYELALVKFDQEDYGECLEALDEVLARQGDHANAKILQARAKIKIKKYEEPTEVEIGTVARQRFLVPGKLLKITLEDQNLSVVGAATDIQVRVWTKAGDEETFSLVPFGDSRTKFRGKIQTALAPVAKSNGVLELLGSDVVYYDYAEAFKKARRITGEPPGTLTVRSDSDLYASSGKIITREEREALVFEAQLRSRIEPGKIQPAAPAEAVALSLVRPDNQVKPGNRINVRVVDLDRSATAGQDSIKVRVTASSGDRIAEFPLTETETHSGVFEAAVPTAASQARAYASDSEPGRDPNMVISARDYPPWVGGAAAPRPVMFSVDLNDNVALGTMKVRADVPGRKLRRFFVQTSMNARTFQTVAAWPQEYVPWDGAMFLEVAKLGDSGRKGSQVANDPAALDEYLETGYLGLDLTKHIGRTDRLAAAWNASLGGLAEKIGLKADTDRFVAHWRAAFYESRRQVRTFVLDHKNKTTGMTYILAVDGQAARAAAAKDLPQVKMSLGKGVHTLDLYVVGTRAAPPEFEVLCDTPEPPYLKPCPPEMFSVQQHPEVREAIRREPAKVAAAADGTAFDVAFTAGSRARVVRLVLVDFETDAPGIAKITLTDAANTAVLPTKVDFMTLRENQVLELVPGDRVTIGYDDPSFIAQGKEHQEVVLTATYTNADLSACFVEYSITGSGERQASYIPMRRFSPGDKINVFLKDPDMDTSEKQDTVKFTVRTSEGQPSEQVALETTEHSGVFVGGIFPVEKPPEKPSELKVIQGDDVILNYLDQENTDPGIPWVRACVVEQVWFEPPEVRVYDVESRPLTAEELAAEANRPAGPAGPGSQAPSQFEENVPVTHTIVATWPEQPREDKPATAMIALPALVEVVFPAIVKSPQSKLDLFAQTSSGRAAKAPAADQPFDLSVPGTIRLTAVPSNPPSLPPPPGYKTVLVRSNPYAMTALDDGRYTFAVPLELGKLPDGSEALEEPVPGKPREAVTLKIKGNDQVYLAIKYTDPQGQVHWVTRSATLKADAFLDIMDRRYQTVVDGIFVGEVLYFRLIDPTRDTSDEKDTVEIEVVTTSGTAKKVPLSETFSHSGVFKGLAKIVYKGEPTETEDPLALAVTYGDQISVTYKPPREEATGLLRVCEVFKGSDGEVVPFTKRFKDPAIAMQTQFTIAEAYFELAKRHRELDQGSLARREIQQGKKLLEEAIRDFPESEARAQAEYLLANLALEFANDAVNEDLRKQYHMEAVNRFSDIVASYPDSIYAPKSQFKKALVFEKMGDIDHACEEYVKLSYRYPDNELVAETIARLGQYFLSKGKDLKDQAEAQQQPLEREKIVLQSHDMFKTAGQVFSRLAVRFPEHRLADKTTVLAAQCYMQATEYEDAVKTFRLVIEKPQADKELAPEAMYWAGDAYMRMAESGRGNRDALKNAYIMFKKLTWDYPASKWAKFARGRLTDPRFENIDTE